MIILNLYIEFMSIFENSLRISSLFLYIHERNDSERGIY